MKKKKFTFVESDGNEESGKPVFMDDSDKKVITLNHEEGIYADELQDMLNVSIGLSGNMSNFMAEMMEKYEMSYNAIMVILKLALNICRQKVFDEIAGRTGTDEDDIVDMWSESEEQADKTYYELYKAGVIK
jgi:hypothetical protein